MSVCQLPWLPVLVASMVLLLGNIVPSSAAGSRRCTLDDYRAGAPKQGHICGKRIPEVLSLVCGGSYRSPTKRDLSKYRLVKISFDSATWNKHTFMHFKIYKGVLHKARMHQMNCFNFIYLHDPWFVYVYYLVIIFTGYYSSNVSPDDPDMDRDWVDAGEDQSINDDDDDDGIAWDNKIFVPRASALSYLRHKRSSENNFRAGVYCECCVHQCAFVEVLSYCRAPVVRHKRHLANVPNQQQANQSWWTNMMTSLFKDDKPGLHSISWKYPTWQNMSSPKRSVLLLDGNRHL